MRMPEPPSVARAHRYRDRVPTLALTCAPTFVPTARRTWRLQICRTSPMLDKPQNAEAEHKLDSALLARFAAIVGDKYAITDPDLQTPYLVEMRNLFQGHTPVVLRPGSVAEVAAVVKLANDTRPRSCRRAAIPAWSAAKFRTTTKWCSPSTGSTASAKSIRSPTR